MVEKRLDIILGAKDLSKRAFKSINASLKRLRRSVKRTFDGLKRAASSAFGKVAALGTALAGAGLSVLVKQSFEAIDALAKLSDRLGISTEAFSGLQVAANRTGVSTRQLELGLQRMTRRIAEAAQGSGEAKAAIRELGLDAKALARLAPDEQFRAIADAMETVGTQSDRVRIGFKLFDSEGVKLINTLRGGGEALAAAQEEAEKLGLALSRVDAAKIEQANDAVSRMRDAFRGLVNRVAIELAPFVAALADQVVRFGTEGGTATEKVADAFDKIGKSLSFVVKAIEIARFSWHAFAASVRTLAAGILIPLQKVEEGVLAINEAFGGEGGVSFVKLLREELLSLAGDSKNAADQIALSFDGIEAKVEATLERMRAKVEQKARESVEAAKREIDKFDPKTIEIPVILTVDPSNQQFGFGKSGVLPRKLREIAEGFQSAFDQSRGLQFAVGMEAIANDLSVAFGKLVQKIKMIPKAIGEGRRAAEREQEQLRQNITRIGEFLADNFNSAFDGFIDGTKSAKEAFSDFARSIIEDLAQIAARQAIVSSVEGLGNFLFPNAKGNVFENGDPTPFASGGVVSRPTIFPMASGGVGLMGEAGPEAILPLRRGRGGRLGVEAVGGSGSVTIINQIQAMDGLSVARVLASPEAQAAQRANALRAQSQRSAFAGGRR